MDTNPQQDAKSRTANLKSKLEKGRQRFLAYALEHAFEVGRRTPEDFIRHFPPRAIMEALSLRPDLRASLLVPATGLKHRIALKKSWESAGDDLQSALDEGEAKPQSIVESFAPDDRVLYLQDKKLWAFLVEGQFWRVTAKEDKASFAMAQQHIAYLLERALLDNLVTPRDVVDGIGVNELCNRLPRSEMASLFTAALQGGRGGTPFTDRDFLAALPPATLVQHVPLSHIYDTVLHARVATVHGYLTIDEPKLAETGAAPAVKDLPGELIGPIVVEPPTNAEAIVNGEAIATAAIAPTEIEVKPESKTNGSRRRSKAPPADGAAQASGAGEKEEDTEWIEIPESSR